MDFGTKVDDSFVERLLESGGWGKAGITLTESVIEEKKEAKQSKAIEVEGAKTVGKSAYDNEKNNPKGITEEHECPLCESALEEALTDEVLEEHSQKMLNIHLEEGLIAESVDEDFIIENSDEILSILTDAGLIVEAVEEDTESEEDDE